MNIKRWHIIFILILSQAWVVNVPIFGGIFKYVVTRSSNDFQVAQVVSVASYFICCVILTFIINKDNLNKIFKFGVCLSVLISLMMLVFPVVQTFYISYALLNFFAAMITISASFMFIYGFDISSRMKAASVFIFSLYLLLYIFYYFEKIFPGWVSFIIITLILLASLIQGKYNSAVDLKSPEDVQERAISAKTLSLLCVVIFIIYFNNAIMVNLINTRKEVFATHPIPQIIALAILGIIIVLSKRVKYFVLIYSCLVAAAILYVFQAVPGLTEIPSQVLAEISGTVSSLFLFAFVGDISLKYGRTMKVFRILLCMVTIGVILGEAAGGLLGDLIKHHTTLSYAVNVSVLFSSFLLTPWLSKSIELEMSEYDLDVAENVFEEKNVVYSENEVLQPANILKLNYAVSVLPDGNRLTPREMEIALLLLERHDYLTIAEKLFISRNTVKGHISRIYEKFNVASKKEFIELIQNIMITNKV